VEHLDPPRLLAFEVLFEFAKPRTEDDEVGTPTQMGIFDRE